MDRDLQDIKNEVSQNVSSKMMSKDNLNSSQRRTEEIDNSISDLEKELALIQANKLVLGSKMLSINDEDPEQAKRIRMSKHNSAPAEDPKQYRF